MQEKIKILAINPGSTSTKFSVLELNLQAKNNKDEIVSVFSKNVKHSLEETQEFKRIADQYKWRKEIILNTLKENNIDLKKIKYVIGRGGLVKNISSGIYKVNEAMKHDLLIGYAGEHACNLGGLIADEIAQSLQIDSFIADPVVVDEMSDIAKVSGHPLFIRRPIFHALNQKAIARMYARKVEKKYEELNLIVAHMGGGISIGVHNHGLVIDVNQALNGDGPFSPERSGSLPVIDVIKACFSGKYTQNDLSKMVVGKGGYVAYLGTNDALEIEKRAKAGDKEADFYESAMAYQIAKEIGAASTVVEGKVDAILLTGGLAYGKPFVEKITKRIQHLAPIFSFPGEDEMNALAFNVFLMLKGDIPLKEYK
ncbi:MAG: butyrate kinase [Bacteroidales bacterium]|nr:butyrate kinase [Bacteroidales bacterium]HQB19396.1 butyrate kinase [Bacteroidales bacterium]